MTDPMVIAAVASAAGGLLTVLVTEGIRWLNSRYDQKRGQRADALAEWKGVADGYKAQLETERTRHAAEEAECRGRVDQLTDAVQEEATARVRAETRIESLEDALRAANIQFRPYVPPPGTDTHKPLPPGGSKP